VLAIQKIRVAMPSSVHVTAQQEWQSGSRPHHRLLWSPIWLLCSALTGCRPPQLQLRRPSQRYMFQFRIFRSSSPCVRERLFAIPATCVAFLKVSRVEDASDIELPRKSLTDRQGPWHTACGYSSMLTWPSCPFLLASSCHIYRPLCRHCTQSSVPTVLCADILVRNAKEDLVLQASARHQ
jgi:hypothetical protein